MTNVLRIVVAAIAVSLFLTWVAPALAQQSTTERRYQSLRLISPAAGATLHDNGGDVEVVVRIDPPLDVAAGHRLAVALDGRVLGLRSTSTSFVVAGVERGEHLLRVFVVSGDGTNLMRSDERTIQVWRASRLFPSRR
jgi:hypothetical protein